MANRRTAKTQKEIKDAFLTLLKEKKIEKIRVSEITELAEISRATFYLHFEDVYKLYESIEEDILSELNLIFVKPNNLNAKDALINRVEQSVEYISKNKDLITVMASNGNILSKIHKAAVHVFLDEFYPTEKTDFGFVEVNFVTWGILGSLQDWVSGSIKLSKEEFTEDIRYILARFIPDAN